MATFQQLFLDTFGASVVYRLLLAFFSVLVHFDLSLVGNGDPIPTKLRRKSKVAGQTNVALP